MCEESLCTKIDTDNVLGKSVFRLYSQGQSLLFSPRYAGSVRPSWGLQCQGSGLEVHCREWKGDSCSKRMERKVKGLFQLNCIIHHA